MIQAIIFRDAGNHIVGFEVSGHAGYAKSGRDIICAAVSILAITTANSLEEQLLVKPQCIVDDPEGFLQCFIPESLTEVQMVKAQAILKTLEIGLISIEQNYPKYIKIKQRRWT